MPTDPRTTPLSFAYWVPNVSGGLVTVLTDPGAGLSDLDPALSLAG